MGAATFFYEEGSAKLTSALGVVFSTDGESHRFLAVGSWFFSGNLLTGNPFFPGATGREKWLKSLFTKDFLEEKPFLA